MAASFFDTPGSGVAYPGAGSIARMLELRSSRPTVPAAVRQEWESQRLRWAAAQQEAEIARYISEHNPRGPVSP